MTKKVNFVKNAAVAVCATLVLATCGKDEPKKEPKVLVLTTVDASAITTVSAVSGGNITDDGGAEVTARGVCWGTANNPTISGSKSTDGKGIGSFTSTITGLTAGTKYYVRAYATNSAGTAYGNEVSFTTVKPDPEPDIKVENETALTQTVFADKTDGKSGVTFVTTGAWTSTITEGTAKSTKAGTITWLTIDPDHGNTAGKYTIVISLEPNATGADRTATITITCNGTDITITVTQKGTKENGEPYTVAPELTTSEVTAITTKTATAGGNITNAGTPAYTERGVVYATTTNPTIANMKIPVAGTGTGDFTAELTGLNADTKYYVRAYATTSNGTVYGNEVNFTTAEETRPTMTMVTAKSGNVRIDMSGTGSVTIDWGDGATSEKDMISVNDWFSHNYADASVRTIRITGENITYLSCYDNQITSLDVSKNTALTNLNCFYNRLTKLDISKNTALTSFSCSSNQLTELDVSKNTALLYLSCSENNLSSLDVSNNTALISLTCYSNPLMSLDVSKNTALIQLRCYYNQLASLNVSFNTALTQLECKGNLLTSLDVSANTALTQLECNGNLLTSLDVSANTALTNLDCGANQLTSLDVSGCAALTSLGCYNNPLKSLNVSELVELLYLVCSNNQLTSLDVSSCVALSRLYCNANNFSVSGLNALFGTLPNSDVGGIVYIYDNPGADSFTDGTVLDNGWRISKAYINPN